MPIYEGKSSLILLDVYKEHPIFLKVCYTIQSLLEGIPMKVSKTNAMRYLDVHRVSYKVHTYEHHAKDPVDGIHVAQMLQEDVKKIFKTLVTQANTKEYLVYMVPVDEELDLKKCAKAAGVKHTEMIHVKDINKVTGYIRGGCSPLGMKKQYRTFIDEQAILYDSIYFSGGKIGVQIEMNPEDLISLLDIQPVSIIKE